VIQIAGRAEKSISSTVTVDGHIIVGAIYREDNALYLRLFNPYTVPQTVTIKGLMDRVVSETNLQGAVIRQIVSSKDQCTVTASAKQLVTLRMEKGGQVRIFP
jgi:hypothetical protein